MSLQRLSIAPFRFNRLVRLKILVMELESTLSSPDSMIGLVNFVDTLLVSQGFYTL